MGVSLSNTYDVIVIGSGLGGLSCALHFAKAGFHVLVLEKQPKVGGYCQSFQRSGYNFDVSLHLLSALDEQGGLRRLLEHLQVLDKLDIEPHDPMFASVFPDRSYEIRGGEAAFGESLKKAFPAERAGIDRFVSETKRILHDNGELFWSGLADRDNFFPARYFKKSYRELQSACFSDPRLHGITGQLWQSTGLPDSLLAANWGAEVFGSHALSGNFYIRGGGQRLAEAMAETLGEAGSVVRPCALVERILLQDRRARGVELVTGEQFFAPIVVSNASPLQTYWSLVGKANIPAPINFKLSSLSPSCSLLTFYLGLDCPGREVGLLGRTMFVNHGYENLAAHELAMAERYEDTDYLISDYTDPSSSSHPAGCGVVQVLEVADGKAWTEIPREVYREKKQRVAETVLAKVSKRFPELRKHIQVLELGTPRTMQLSTRNPFGAVYGFAQTPGQADSARFGVKSIFGGLYFTGAWCRGGGGGYMGAIVNGRVAYREILAANKLEEKPRRIATRPRRRPTREATPEPFKLRLPREIEAKEIARSGELKQDACVSLFNQAAESCAAQNREALFAAWPGFAGLDVGVFVFSARFVFVPGLRVAAGEEIFIEIELIPKAAGKAELNGNIVLGRTLQKLANVSAHAIVRSR